MLWVTWTMFLCFQICANFVWSDPYQQDVRRKCCCRAQQHVLGEKVSNMLTCSFFCFVFALFVCFHFHANFLLFFFFLPSDRLVFDLYWVQQCVCYIGFISQHSLFGLVWENALKHPVILFCLLRFIFRQSWYSYSNSLVFCLSGVRCIDCELIMWRKSKQTIIWYSLFFWFRRNNVLFSVGNVYCRFRSTVRDKVEEILPSFEELLVCMALTRMENKVSLAHWQLSALRSQEFDNPVLWHFSTLATLHSTTRCSTTL